MMYSTLITLCLLSLPFAPVIGGDPIAHLWSKRRDVLSLEHVITGVDSLHLRRADVAFDGGSLLFGFALEKSAPTEVFVFLPNPKVGGIVDGRQIVVVGNHPHLSRFAFLKPTDPLYRSFRKLIAESKVGVPEELNNIESLTTGKEVLTSVIKNFAPPVKWGDAALSKQDLGEDTFEGDLDDIFK